MEENNEIGENKPVTNVGEQNNTTTAAAEVETAKAEEAQTKTSVVEKVQYRKNGRNHSIKSSVKSSGESSAKSCGELEDLSSFKEKLSGSNVFGYGDSNGRRGHREHRERREDLEATAPAESSEKPSQVAEVSEAVKSEESAPVSEGGDNRDGPSFENEKFSPRAIEVPLSDRRPRDSRKNGDDSGVVSYTGIDTGCPAVGIFARIKAALTSLFGRKKQKKYRGGKFNGDRKPFNNNRRHGGHNRYNDRRGGGFKGGDKFGGKRRFNDRRSNNGGFKRDGGSEQ